MTKHTVAAAAAQRICAAFWVVIAMTIGLGCANNRLPLTPNPMPTAKAAKPLPGTVAIMLPYDLRPQVEHKGSAPGLEYIIYLVFIEVDAERGSYVTSDADYRLPYSEKEALWKFGPDPVVAAAVGESVLLSIDQARVFEGVTRLRPPDRRASWPLAEKNAPPPMPVSVPPELSVLSPAEQEAQELQSRALATPLPPFSTEWLLRVHILHLYASQFSTNVNTIASAGKNSTYSTTQTKGYAPSGNAVLACELYHRGEGSPALVWKRTVSGTATGPAVGPSYRELTLRALGNALAHLTGDLIADAPGILTRANTSQFPIASDASPSDRQEGFHASLSR
ncbi:MAG: hypothetical protein ABR964_12590 [Tepidisphaeraceae bacterium]|jgi:hypothetical protein